MADVGASAPLKIFISYSRRDMAFADRLVDALTARGFEVRIDRRDLPKLEDWRRELLDFIRQADTVVFIASPHSLASSVVDWEIEQVGRHAKRLAPVVIADVGGVPVPADVARINHIFFTDEAAFERRADELARALNTDVAWLKEHTRLGELARRWLERGKPRDLLIRGSDLAGAALWAGRRPRDAPVVTDRQRAFLSASRSAQTRRRRVLAVLGLLLAGSLGYAGWSNQAYLKVRWGAWADAVRPKVLTAARERALKPKESFSECSSCPEMVVLPTGEFLMGSPAGEPGRRASEGPQRKVAIGRAFAVSRFEVTFAEWDACAALGGCDYQPPDQGWGRGTRPAINISRHDAQQYAAWLASQTGKPYRLLTEAEWEYAARAGSPDAHPFAHANGAAGANCKGCGSGWDNRHTASVGSFPANAFGLHDMHGNVWEWVEDCWHDSYRGAPTDGSAWTSACTDVGNPAALASEASGQRGDSSKVRAHSASEDARERADDTRPGTGLVGAHVVRGGSWNDDPADLRAAARYPGPSGIRSYVNGLRLGRTLRQ